MPTFQETLAAIGPDGASCLFTIVLAAFVSIILTPTVRHFAFWARVIDQPGPRRVHREPTARLGGLGVLAGILVATILGAGALDLAGPRLWATLGLASGVCLLGAVDDRVSISPLTKLLGLGSAGALLSLTGFGIDVVHVPGFEPVHLGAFGVLATIVWVVACANAVNLIDGVDGAATGVVTIAAGTMAMFALGTGDALAAVLFGAVAGAAGGFLVHNRQPASIFLGDSGSLLLGFMIAAASAAGSSKGPTAWVLFGTLATLAVPFLDAIQSFVRRFRRAHPGGKLRSIVRAVRATAVADTGHIHHRLLIRGLSHHRVSFILHAVTAIVGLTILLLVPRGTVHWTTALLPLVIGVFALYRLAALKPHEEPTVEIPYPDATTQPTGSEFEHAAPAQPSALLKNTDEPDPKLRTRTN